MHVHLVHQPAGKPLKTLEESLISSIQLTYGEDHPCPAEIDVLVSGRPSPTFLEECQNLQALIIPFAGIPEETRELMQTYPQVGVFNLHHNAGATAELGVALILAAAKRILSFDQKLRSHDWRPRYQPDHTVILAGRQALIVGFGEIGRRIGRVLQAMEVDVTGIRRHGKGKQEHGVEVHSPAMLDPLLSMAEILVLSLPLTDDTYGLIGKSQLQSLPENAILVNISRGPIVDQEALFEILKEGRIAGAGLDVWYHYPSSPEERAHTPPADFPFHTLENVVLSPHRGGLGSSTENLRMAALAASLNAGARGEVIPNRVNLQLGY